MSTDLTPPIVLASGQHKPYAVTVDSTCVYWTNNGDGTVMMLPMAGGTPTVLAESYTEAGAIIASDGWLYWSAFRSGSVSKLKVEPLQSAAKPITLVTGYFGIGQIALGPDFLCFVVYDGPLVYDGPGLSRTDAESAILRNPVVEPDRPGIVATVPITGGPVRILQREQPSLSDVLLDGFHVYWTCLDGVRTRSLAAPTADPACSLAGNNGGHPMSLVKSGPVLYWTHMGENTGEIYSQRVNPPGASATPLVTNLKSPYRLALDETHLYWTNYTAQGSVMRCPLSGAPVEVLASNQEFPAGITVDNENIYWVNMIEQGTVMKLPKPKSKAR